MNSTRARDMYSQYREGTLDAHAKAALERAWQESPQLREDYQRFCEVLDALEAQRDEPIPEPYMLHERIVARLDKAVLESKRSKSPMFSGWRTALIGAVGATAIIAAVLNMGVGGNGATADLAPTPKASSMTWNVEGKGIRLYHSAGRGTIQVFADHSTKPEYEAPLGSARIEIPLVNRDSAAHVYRIQSGRRMLTIALPGGSTTTPDSGSGTVEDFAVAVATRFQTPVEVQYNGITEPAEWQFKGTSPVEIKVSGAPVSVQELADGKLVIN